MNFDAESELAEGYPPDQSASLKLRLSQSVESFRKYLDPLDFVLSTDSKDQIPNGLRGRAWCPTPGAIRELLSVGAIPDPSPSFEVLRHVNSRAFQIEVLSKQTAESSLHSILCRSSDELMDHISTGAFRQWILKKMWSGAGRGKRIIDRENVLDGDKRWIQKTLSRSAVLCEPFVKIFKEFTMHGWIGQDGSMRFGRPCRQTCARGQWQETSPLRLRSQFGHSRVEQSIEIVAMALLDAQYFGAFGVDSFVWRDQYGKLSWRSIGDINARFTTGWSLGMGRSISEAGLA